MRPHVQTYFDFFDFLDFAPHLAKRIGQHA
jgi:hypothetical protein